MKLRIVESLIEKLSAKEAKGFTQEHFLNATLNFITEEELDYTTKRNGAIVTVPDFVENCFEEITLEKDGTVRGNKAASLIYYIANFINKMRGDSENIDLLQRQFLATLRDEKKATKVSDEDSVEAKTKAKQAFETKFNISVKDFEEWEKSSTKAKKNGKIVPVTLEWLMASISSVYARYPDKIRNLDAWETELKNANITLSDIKSKINIASPSAWGFSIIAVLDQKALNDLTDAAKTNTLAAKVLADLTSAKTLKRSTTANPFVLRGSTLTGNEWVITLIKYLNDLDDRYIGIGDNKNHKSETFDFTQYE